MNPNGDPESRRFNVRWGISADGKPTIELPEGIPAGCQAARRRARKAAAA